MFEVTKENWRHLKDGRPGRRFRDYYNLRKDHRRGRWAKLATITGGILLILFGLAVSWIPGPGGFLAIIGLAMITKEIRGVAAAMDRAERTLLRLSKKLRGSDRDFPAA